MNGRFAVLAILLAAPLVSAEDLLREIGWDAAPAAGRAPAAEVLPPGPETPAHVLRVRADAPGTVPLLVLEKPGVLARGFVLAGRARAEGADGTRLEMLVYGPPGGPWFSRCELAPGSGWQAFRLPFRFDGDDPVALGQLVLSAIFAGPGTVELGPLRLLQCAPGEDPFQPGAWWDDRTAGWIGGILGGALGLLGAFVGVLASRGAAPRLVAGALRSVAVLGFVLLAGGTVALAFGQPYAVYYPLLLVGALCATLGLSLRRTLRARQTSPAPPSR